MGQKRFFNRLRDWILSQINLRLVPFPIFVHRKVDAAGRAVFCTRQKFRQDEAVKQPTPIREFPQIPPVAANPAERTCKIAGF